VALPVTEEDDDSVTDASLLVIVAVSDGKDSEDVSLLAELALSVDED
jgi:hypothetical protein